MRTSLTLADLPDDMHRLRLDIERAIPVGFSAHEREASAAFRRDPQLASRFRSLMGDFSALAADNLADREGKAAAQCGTLGGGNHFIEVTADDDGQVWLMLHSGSRNIGKEIAERHIGTAKGMSHNAGYGDMAVFLRGSKEMEAYLHDLYWAQAYALLNRDIMLGLLCGVVSETFEGVSFGETIRCHHNYVSEETYDGADLIVTRKGAIFAGLGTLGLIPGSMGTGSYVVRGLGNTEGLCSASHGAGRRMSRGAAKRQFSVDDLAEQTRGVECRKDQGVVDEIPGAYKDLESVIGAQTKGDSPLVEVVARLTTLLCVKG